MPPSVTSLRPAHHRQHRGLAAAGMADQRDELALADVELESFDDGQRTLAASDRPCDVVELDELVGVRQRLRLVGRAHGFRHEVRRGDRHDVRQLHARLRPAPASRAPTSSRYCVICGAQLPILRDRDSRALRSRGRGRFTLNSRPSVARGPGVSGMMRSASSSASSTSLVTSTTVFVSSRQIASISSCSLARVSASSADSGSSSSRNLRIHRERARHRDALAHAAGELRRTAIGRVRRARPCAMYLLGARAALRGCPLRRTPRRPPARRCRTP